MKRFLFLYMTLVSMVAAAQVELPDTNFLNFIERDYPYAITTDGLLDTISADTIQGYFDLDDEGVYSIEGVQYFKSVKGVFCDSNYITDLSPLSTLTQITDLHCHANQLTELPDFSQFVNLQFLYCFDNELEAINGLEHTKLKLLDLHGNNFTDFEVLAELKDLEILYMQDNALESLPSLDSLTKLRRVDLNNNKLQEIGPIAHMTDVEYFTAQGNELNFVTLQHVVDHPDLEAPDVYFYFNAQKSVYNDSLDDVILVGETDTLRCPSHFRSPYNIYQWYRNGVAMAGANDSIYVIHATEESEPSIYLCRIMNEYDSRLSFTQFDVYYIGVEVVCFDVLTPALELDFYDCNVGWSIIFDKSEIRGISPFEITLWNEGNEVLETTPSSFSRLFQKEFTLRIDDGLGCTLDTMISRPTYPVCEEDLIFTPNNDGVYDDFYIEQTGSAKIYNKSGRLIKEIETPTTWDGSDLNNLPVPDGYYVIIIDNGEVIHVAVKR